MPCRCKTSCDSRRCACLKSGQACTVGCECYQCKNPLNEMTDLDRLHPCLLSNIKQYKKLDDDELSEMLELPCDCEEVALKDVINGYQCSHCEESYRYSFCWRTIIEEEHFWHCERCNCCREDREWHCQHCDRCTYGLTLPCDSCGRKSPYHC